MEAPDRAVTFINRLTHTKGKHAGHAFDLRDWQEHKIIRPIFGTLDKAGLRQYRTVYIEIPRKNGKSEIAAAVALYMLMGDGELGAEVYSAAADRDQASLVFNVAAQMCRNDRELSDYVRIVDSQKRIVYPNSGGFYRAISAEAYSKHGFNASAIIYDELHAATNRDLYDVLTTSTGAREQPLTFLITTAGYDKNSICYELHDYAVKVRDGIIEDPTFLPVIFAAEPPEDEKQNPDWWLDEKVWHKANPALGDFRNIEEMRMVAKRAKEVPAQQNTFKRLYLNIWTEQETRWLDMAAWKGCEEDYTDDLLKNRPCIVGMDLSTKIDLTAVVMLFPPCDHDPFYRVRCMFFMPAENLRKREARDKVPYSQWVKQGFITTTEGDVIDYDFILDYIVNTVGKEFNIVEIGFDPWNATQIALQLQDEGFDMVEVRQGIRSMGEPSKELEALILSKELRHDGNPVLTWMASNVSVRTDPNGNYMPQKPDNKAPFRIDGVVALIIALARAIVNRDDGLEPYSNGLVVV